MAQPNTASLSHVCTLYTHLTTLHGNRRTDEVYQTDTFPLRCWHLSPPSHCIWFQTNTLPPCVTVGTSPKSSKHLYKRLDFTINNHRLSASEQPAIIKGLQPRHPRPHLRLSSRSICCLRYLQVEYESAAICQSVKQLCEAIPSTCINHMCFCESETKNYYSCFELWGVEYLSRLSNLWIRILELKEADQQHINKSIAVQCNSL